jgi:hypothetical protein
MPHGNGIAASDLHLDRTARLTLRVMGARGHRQELEAECLLRDDLAD